MSLQATAWLQPAAPSRTASRSRSDGPDHLAGYDQQAHEQDHIQEQVAAHGLRGSSTAGQGSSMAGAAQSGRGPEHGLPA